MQFFKKIEKQLTKGFSHEEEKSRLKALADTMDTRGWVVKNALPGSFNAGDTERLFDISPTANPTDSTSDIFDASSSQTAMKLEQMLKEHTTAQKQEIIEKIPYNGVTETEDKSPAILLSFASVMMAFYIFAKDE